MMTEPDFWDDQNKAQEVIDKNNALKSVVNGYHELEEEVEGNLGIITRRVR